MSSPRPVWPLEVTEGMGLPTRRTAQTALPNEETLSSGGKANFWLKAVDYTHTHTHTALRTRTCLPQGHRPLSFPVWTVGPWVPDLKPPRSSASLPGGTPTGSSSLGCSVPTQKAPLSPGGGLLLSWAAQEYRRAGPQRVLDLSLLICSTGGRQTRG